MPSRRVCPSILPRRKNPRGVGELKLYRIDDEIQMSMSMSGIMRA